MAPFGKRNTEVIENPFTESSPAKLSPSKDGEKEAVEVPDRIWEFIKNINQQEVVVFEDGSKFVFPSTRFVTADPKLAEKLKAVASRYNIIQ